MPAHISGPEPAFGGMPRAALGERYGAPGKGRSATPAAARRTPYCQRIIGRSWHRPPALGGRDRPRIRVFPDRRESDIAARAAEDGRNGASRNTLCGRSRHVLGRARYRHSEVSARRPPFGAYPTVSNSDICSFPGREIRTPRAAG